MGRAITMFWLAAAVKVIAPSVETAMRFAPLWLAVKTPVAGAAISRGWTNLAVILTGT